MKNVDPLDLINSQNSDKLGLGLDSVMTFKKHKGETVREVLQYDAGYIKWMIDNTDITFAQEVKDYDLPIDNREIMRQLERDNWDLINSFDDLPF